MPRLHWRRQEEPLGSNDLQQQLAYAKFVGGRRGSHGLPWWVTGLVLGRGGQGGA